MNIQWYYLQKLAVCTQKSIFPPFRIAGGLMVMVMVMEDQQELEVIFYSTRHEAIKEVYLYLVTIGYGVESIRY